MIMIVCLHYLGHGGVLKKASLHDGNFYVAWFAELLCIVGVNCFILCTGYLMAENRFKFSKIVNLWLQMVCIGAVCVLAAALTKTGDITLGTVVSTVFPINYDKYWYMSAYIAFYLLSPLLIWIANTLTLNQLKKLVIVLVIVFSLSPFQWTRIGGGYHVVWFCVLFFAAAYIRKADLFKKSAKTYFGYYLLFTVVLLVIKVLMTVLPKTAITQLCNIDVRNYNFILTLASSLMLFAAFKNMRIGSQGIGRLITLLSSLTLGVYLIHDNPIIRELLWGKVVHPLSMFDKPYFVLHLIASILAVFFICAFLEYFRQLLFKLFGVPALCEKIGGKLQGLADKLFSSNTLEKL